MWTLRDRGCHRDLKKNDSSFMALRKIREGLLIGDLKYHVGYTCCILEGIQGGGILGWKITYF